MNIRLLIAGILLRGRGQMRWLHMIDQAVIEALTPLIGEESVPPDNEETGSNDPDTFRLVMSRKHAHLVDRLVAAHGGEGISAGRKAMHDAGARLGTDIGMRLGLTGDEGEFIAAAGLLYRILGIEFDVDEDRSVMNVRRCSLSQAYTPLTCEVISAMDEGVVSRLDPRVEMRFIERNGDGSPMCRAELSWKVGR